MIPNSRVPLLTAWLEDATKGRCYILGEQSLAVMVFSMGKASAPSPNSTSPSQISLQPAVAQRPSGKGGVGTGQGHQGDTKGGTFAPCVPSGASTGGAGRLMGSIINARPLIGVTSRGAAGARVFLVGAFHRLQSLGNAGLGLRAPAASSGSARRENPRDLGHLHPWGFGCSPRQGLRSGRPWKRRWERSGKEPKGAAGCFIFPGQPSTNRGGSRCDEKAAAGPRAPGKGEPRSRLELHGSREWMERAGRCPRFGIA